MRTSSLAVIAAVTTLVVLAGTATVHAQTRASTTAGQKTAMATGVANMAGCSVLLEGVAGESSDGSIQVQSFSWGASNAGTMAGAGGGMGAGKATFKEFTVTKRTDKTSPALMMRAVSGTRSKSVVLSCRDAGTEYYRVTLQDVLISSYVSQSGDGMPMESLSLNFTKIEFSYTPKKADGTLDAAVKASYDLKAAKK